MAITVTSLVANLKLKADSAAFKKAKKAVSELKDSIKQLAVAGGAAATGLFLLTKGVSDQIREVEILSKRFGMSTQSLQTWLSLSEKAGIESSQFADGIKDLTIKVGQIRKQTDPAAQALKELGLNFRQLKEDSPEVRLEKVLKALNGVEDASDRAALAAAVAGDTGGQTFITLSTQVGNYAAEREALANSGALISKQDTRDAEEMANSLHDLSNVVFGVKKAIATSLIPIIKKLSARLQEWFGKNKDVIGQKVEKIVDKLSTAFEILLPLIAWAAENVDKLVFAWVAFKGVQIAIALGTVTTSLWAMFAAEGAATVAATAMWVALTGPIGIAIAQVLLIVGAVYVLYKNWDSIKKIFGQVIDAIAKGIKWIVDGVIKEWNDTLTGIGDAFQWIADQFTDFKDWVADAFDIDVLSKFKGYLDDIGELVGWIGNKLGFGDSTIKVEKVQGTSLASVNAANINRAANTVSIAKPGQLSIEAPEVTNNISVYLGTKEIKELAKQEARVVVDKQLRNSAP